MRPSLIDTFMPEFRMRQVDRVRVRASPEAAWKVIRALDIGESPLSRALFALRAIPEKLLGRSATPAQAKGIDGFTGPGKGFQILAEEPGSEIVIGSVGKFWKPSIEWARIDSLTFTAFRKPGFGKLAWNLRVDPDSQGGTWITWDLRVGATDDRTWGFFRIYWLLIGAFSHWLRRAGLRRFSRKLGGAVSDESLRLPGDELVPTPRYQKTMSVSIEAKPSDVWPWLAQMGCQRAGWYSIDALDNAGIPSASRIVPELQSIEVGQVLPWKPEGKEGFTVLRLEKNHALVLGTAPLLAGPHRETAEFDDTWTFFLEPMGGSATRVITRVRATFRPSLKMALLRSWLGFAHWIMERAQLRNLKTRIEVTP